jgi:hypothetical protein
MSSRTLKSLTLLAIFAGMAGNSPAPAQETLRINGVGSRDLRDMSKMRVESPVKGLLGGYREPVASESTPLKSSMRKEATPVKPAKAVGSTPRSVIKQLPTEKVEPGKVRWHKAIQTAMDASRQSGKPVLLFQMMGRLDDRFC